ncbi:putative membrane protein [Pedobacter cryoconitis]|uniref:Putative membrane protein n=1 Tax=Pedobacter cryoconitis TaxID=188932 RepID=A0A7W9E0N6_9SPHI|nr:PH domain-containing protein [Pedobacter cryoconitis]MBB5636805.1 putative membrane protein [Pedobacter cryoconitis]MBB6271201.1 putative membrane protein [Pedobacter cryoconitis]
MENDFSKPQRQSAAGIIIMGSHTALQIVKIFIIPFAISLVNMKTNSLIFLISGLVIVIFLSFLFAYLWYLKFTFFLNKDKQEFIINKGIFNRDQIIIQLDKIQQVNINQTILQKIIGVYGLKIDTAGSNGVEANIMAIDESSAYNLKEHLLNKSTDFALDIKENDEANITTEDLSILQISASTLFKVGLTSNYGRSSGLLILFLASLFHEGQQIIKAFKIDSIHYMSLMSGMATMFSIAILVVTLLLLFLIFNLVSVFYKYFELKITRHKHSLLISYGLFAKKNTLVNPKKVQITKYTQNFLQKKIRLLNMSLKQAHYGKSKDGHEMQGNTLEIVGCNANERDELLKMILGKIPAKGKIFIPNWRFLNLPIFFNLVIPVVVFLIIGFNVVEISPYLPLAGFYFLTGVLMIYISYKRHDITVNEEFIIKKSGIWDISHEIIMPDKIQAITTFQYPWHKGVDVGHLCLHTAAGQIRFKYGNYTEIKHLVNYWLYQVESGNKGWM